MHYVIIGNGVASIGAIEGIRKHDKTGNITVITEEDVPTYGRPLISYYLGGKVDQKRLQLKETSFYEVNNVDARLGSRVDHIKPEAKTIHTTGGQTIPFDKLLIATGGEPVIPHIPGAVCPGVCCFTRRSDAQTIIELLDSAKSVTVVGAGLIALKAAEGLVEHGQSVTLLVRSRLMRAYFDEYASELLARYIESQGVRLVFGASPKTVLSNGEGYITGLATTAGDIATDLIILAAGVQPRTELTKGTPITVEKGILVNDHMLTSVPDIYAAGDVAQAIDFLTGKAVVMPIWPSAYNQGFIAGRNMAGGEVSCQGELSMNSISYFGLPTMSVGIATPDKPADYEIHTTRDDDTFTYRKLVFQDDILVGYLLIGDIDNAGLYTGFVRFRIRLDEEQKANIIDGKPSPLDWPEAMFHADLRHDGPHWHVPE
ncbi:NAD(P)/FAD-dependent oxidoreductase [Desulfovibrio inopinatus]|uniref:NAD(P)/FAD-dependent oxidoreductase n=1 Tax=Desulfovibrio inopinatus TaxID=102109 RepID=UPI0003F734F6|nr:FAD-dependent oxidoreductase [Desulfovibrio inopinatus]